MSKNRDSFDHVFDLGGSLLYKRGSLDIPFLSRFTQFIASYKSLGRVAIVIGGGKICRDYQNAARRVLGDSALNLDRELDWIGVASTKLNASLLKALLSAIAYPHVLESPHAKIEELGTYNVFLFSGWKPGWSTDYVSVLVAKRFGVDTVLSLSNIKGVYRKEGEHIKRGDVISTLTWVEYERMIDSQWHPGMKVPLDPVATKKAKEEGLRVVVMSGKSFSNLSRFLSGKSFMGTVIS